MLYIGPVPDLVPVLVWLFILRNHIQHPAIAALALVDSDFGLLRSSEWFGQPVGDLECWLRLALLPCSTAVLILQMLL